MTDIAEAIAQLADLDRKDRTAAVLAMTLRAARELDVAPPRKRKRRVVLRAANTLKASRLTEGAIRCVADSQASASAGKREHTRPDAAS